jgi:hypothetical protein
MAEYLSFDLSHCEAADQEIVCRSAFRISGSCRTGAMSGTPRFEFAQSYVAAATFWVSVA